MKYYADHRSVTVALAVLMPIGLVGLTTFLGAVLARVARGAGRAVGDHGCIRRSRDHRHLHDADRVRPWHRRLHPSWRSGPVAVVDGMWVAHNAVFGLLAGMRSASRSPGSPVPRLRPASSPPAGSKAGLVGGGLLLAGAMTTPAIIDGSPRCSSASPDSSVWIAFVIRTSVALLRQPQV